MGHVWIVFGREHVASTKKWRYEKLSPSSAFARTTVKHVIQRYLEKSAAVNERANLIQIICGMLEHGDSDFKDNGIT